MRNWTLLAAALASAGCVSPGLARHLGPEDFKGSTLTFEVPASPGGKTILILAPGISSPRWQRGGGLSMRITIAVEDGSAARELPGRPLPQLPRPPRNNPPDSKSVAAAPGDEITFRVYRQATDDYVKMKGRRAHAGKLFSFYEDPANRKNFSQADYETLEARLIAAVPTLASLFGPPSDADGNGRILVFVSATVAEVHPEGESYVDGADAGRAEIVYFWSLDALDVPDAIGWFERNILHETVHLCQNAHSIRKYGKVLPRAVPAYVVEGSAELPRYLFRLGLDEKWPHAARYLRSDDPSQTPFNYEYHFGSLIFWWLHQMCGEGVHAAMLDALWEPGDPFVRALGVPEPLMLAMMTASLAFDETEFGRRTGLEFPLEDIPRRGCAPPAMRLTVGERRERTLEYTGTAIVEIEHRGPVRITIETADPDRAYVIVARP